MQKLFLLLIMISSLSTFLVIYWMWWYVNSPSLVVKPAEGGQAIITPISGTKHFMVSAFKDHRWERTIRVISMLHKKMPQKIYCVLCDKTKNGSLGQCMSGEARYSIHRDSFPYGSGHVFCDKPALLQATHVSITAQPDNSSSWEFIPIQHQVVKEVFKYKFTICISNLYGEDNNALQFVQAIEMYKILGVQRIVIYNTSCGPDVDKVLRYYSKMGIVEVVPWPIGKFLKPSGSSSPQLSPGDILYYGQITTLNDCMYRYMYQSRYVLLHDIDEIMMPYHHSNLQDFVGTLEKQHPNTGVFHIFNYVFPRTASDDSGRFALPEWRNVPGVNILEHIYRMPDTKDIYDTKLLLNPRLVEETVVHSTDRRFGKVIEVSSEQCRLVHIRFPKFGHVPKENLIVDRRLWDFEKELVPNINQALHESGLLL